MLHSCHAFSNPQLSSVLVRSVLGSVCDDQSSHASEACHYPAFKWHALLFKVIVLFHILKLVLEP
jgi:hypothetical protein